MFTFFMINLFCMLNNRLPFPRLKYENHKKILLIYLWLQYDIGHLNCAKTA
jgi:hypothetical protein